MRLWAAMDAEQICRGALRAARGGMAAGWLREPRGAADLPFPCHEEWAEGARPPISLPPPPQKGAFAAAEAANCPGSLAAAPWRPLRRLKEFPAALCLAFRNFLARSPRAPCQLPGGPKGCRGGRRARRRGRPRGRGRRQVQSKAPRPCGWRQFKSRRRGRAKQASGGFKGRTDLHRG